MSHEKLFSLFTNDFGNVDLLKRGKGKKFTCPHIKNCNVNINKNPIWTPIFGDLDTKVMLVAEAPSSSGGNGVNIGGHFNDANLENFALLNFVKKYFDTIPYFTDVMKCGVPKQTNENKSKFFKERKLNCINHYLFKEIEIIDPEVILCIGNTAFDVLKNHPSTKKCEVIQLVHYSKQANLPLTFEDKENIIWPIQIGKGNLNNLNQLSYFLKKKKKKIE